MVEEKQRPGLISTWPFEDTIAVLALFLLVPNWCSSPIFLGYLYAKRRWIGSHSVWANRIYLMSLLMAVGTLYSSHQFYDFLHTTALAIVAAAMAGSRRWWAHAIYSTIGATIVRLSWHFYLDALSKSSFASHDAEPLYFEDASRQLRLSILAGRLLVTMVACVGFADYLGAVLPYEPEENVKKNKKLSSMRSRQPLWSWLALLRLAAPTDSASSSGFCPQIRFVEDHLVGLLMLGPESLLFRVDGVDWTQVYCNDKKNLAVIYGLSPCVSYSVEAIDPVTMHAAKFSISTNVPENADGVSQRTPMSTLVDALTTAQSALNDERNKLRKMKKEHTKRLGHLRQEMAASKEKQLRTIKVDDRSRRKATTLNEQVRQLQEDIDALKADIETLQSRQPESQSVYMLRKQEWQEKRTVREGLMSRKASQQKEWQQVKDALASEVLKLEARIAKQHQRAQKLEEDLAVVGELSQQATDALLKQRASNRELKMQRRRHQQAEFNASVQKLEDGVVDLQQRTAHMQQAAGSWNDWS